jgi:hypothetical protein
LGSKNGDDFALTALLCAAEDGDIRNLKDLLQITSLDINKGNKVGSARNETNQIAF